MTWQSHKLRFAGADFMLCQSVFMPLLYETYCFRFSNNKFCNLKVIVSECKTRPFISFKHRLEVVKPIVFRLKILHTFV